MPLDTQGAGAAGILEGQIRYAPIPNRIHYAPVTDQVRFIPVKERVVVRGSPEHVRIVGLLASDSLSILDQAA
ncbi:hypothetical protein [Chthonomonas calidirosea]|uniref:Uncharacterized protein n=1 Tax=Chthonomonas calidirosea (strain DSM 23976 / ICMP 18418 / T49) TaxID=1303518 RepID=S0F044_CHTCT|nr:hypothetical protein [Chthonomonas calidirosea]CCW36477.1 hypothetical protein CCALI_02687 [Chthonomonas calidirosea T49]CEK16133.1 hypothetical protein CP488_01404 [Chthonomonas calidirosea]CEK17223.1 hypothetical protein CTKA_01404 [Chthonomonas calidirosea]